MFDRIKDQFLAALSSQHKAAATIVAYGKDVEQLIGFLRKTGKQDIGDVIREDLELYIADLKRREFTAKTISRKINSIKTFYRFLKSEGLIKVNYASDLTHPKYELKNPRILTKMEYRALRDVVRAEPRTYAIVELFLQTGMRISEVAGLEMGDIQDDSITIGSRTIPLNAVARDALTGYLKTRPTNGKNTHVFITKNKRPLLIRNIRTAIDRALKTAGVDNAKVNDLRTTFIAYQLAAGAPLEYISGLVGHKRVSTTERYLGLVEEKPKKGAKLVEL